MCCCSSNESVFAWIGAVLVNIAFISLIGWGASTIWPLGFILSALYTGFLLFFARYLEQNLSDATGSNNATGGSEEEYIQQDDISATNPDSSRTFKKIPVLVNMLYGLGVISLGVTGFFLPVNLLDCTGTVPSKSVTRYKYSWRTNETELPPSVREWASNQPSLWDKTTFGASFAYVPSTGITMFEGTDFSDSKNKPSLWTLKGGADPTPTEHQKYESPSRFISMSDNAVCFQPDPMPATGSFWLFCSDGIEFRQEQLDHHSNPDTPIAHYNDLRSLFPVNGTLWFKELASKPTEYGGMVYSLDPETMVSTLHSKRIPVTPEDNSPKDGDCDGTVVVRKLALLSLLVSVIPMTALSIILWKNKRVPSMGILFYVCISLIYLSIHFAISPEDADGEFFTGRWWFAVSGLLCLVVSAHLLLSIHGEISIDSSHAAPLKATLATSALAFAYGMSMLFFFDEFDNRDTLGRWILWNVFMACPLILIGAATDSVSVLCLGGLVFISDAFRIAAIVDSTLFFFLVFSLIGLSVGTLGYFFVRRYQVAIRSWSRAQVQAINRCVIAKCHPLRTYQELVTTQNEVDSSSLLLQEEPSSEQA
eukprot:scaffold2212_cov143-Cylindrotheca_fusiformis.AAC.5